MLLLFIILIITLVTASPVIILNNKAFSQPKVTKCANPDIPGFPGPVYTECDTRSTGCNTDTLSCILSPTVGYLSGDFLNFTITPFSETMPGTSDGKVFVKLSYSVASLLALKGYVQLFRYTKTVDGIDLYDFTYRQSFINAGLVDPYTGVQYGVWFNKLVAGTYVVVYYDVGGTRYGLDLPEMSNTFVVKSYFPIKLNMLRVEFMPQYEDPATHGYKYVDTFIQTGRNPYVSYRITAEPEVPDWLLQQWFTTGASSESHNRAIGWEHRTDIGNLINAKRDILATTSPYDPDQDTMFKFKHYPMVSGGYRCNTPRSTCTPTKGRKTVITARLFYDDLTPANYGDYWDIASHGRQTSYGHGTDLASKVFALTAVEFDGYSGVPPANNYMFPQNIANDYNNVQTDLVAADGTKYDLFEIYYLKNTQAVCTDDTSCEEKVNEGMNFAGGTGDLMYEDFYTAEDMGADAGAFLSRIFMYESHGFRFRPKFIDHENFVSDVSDLYCVDVGGAYAAANDRAGTTNRNRYTMSDIEFSMQAAYEYFSQDECDSLFGCVMPGGCECKDFLWAYESGACGDVCTDWSADSRIYMGVSATCPPWVMASIGLAAGNIHVDPIASTTSANPTLWEAGSAKYTRAIKDCFAGGRPPYYVYVNDITSALLYDAYHMTDNTAYPFAQTTTSSKFLFGNRASMVDGDGDGFIAQPLFLVPPTDCYPKFPGNGCPLAGVTPAYLSVPANFDQFSLSMPSSPYGYLRGEFGLDTQTATVQYRFGINVGGGGTMFKLWFGQLFFTYARFKVYPTITFLNFKNARLANNGLPDTIELVFEISCPLVETGWDDSYVGYCAEIWSVTNQDDVTDLVISVVKGPQNTLSAAYNPFDVTLGPVKTKEMFTVKLRYNDGDEIRFRFLNRNEPEKAIHDAHCDITIGLPYPLIVPPKPYEFISMKTSVGTAQPACEFSQQEVIAHVVAGQPYIYEAVLNDPFSNDITTGQPYDGSNVLFYYYTWTGGSLTSNTLTSQGFDANAQFYDPPMTVSLCDSVTCQIIPDGGITVSPLPAIYPNPLYRAPRCADTSIYGTCSVNDQDDPIYSGIDILQTADTTSGTCQNIILAKPRLKFIFPYSLLNNVGSITWSDITDFVDPVLLMQETEALFTQVMSYIVTTTKFISARIRYGLTIDSLFKPACVESLITKAVILTNFQIDPAPPVRIAGCARSDNCCYRIPFVITGNNPHDNEAVDMDDNVTNSCYGEPACLYEVVSSPPPNVDGGLCLGVEYTFTVQSPAALVAARFIPAYVYLPDEIIGNSSAPRVNSSLVTVPQQSYPYAWRCPNSITLTLPIGGISPIDLQMVPASCATPGTDVQFLFTVNDATCSGPVSTSNSGPSGCKRNLYVAIETLHAVSCSPSVCPTILSPHLITGSETFTYNIQSSFFALGVPNGYWRATFWTATTGGPQDFASMTDVAQIQTIDFLASLADTEGFSLVRTSLFRPKCAGPNIVVNFNFKSLTARFPYTAEFRTPSGRLISSQTVNAIDYCNSGIVDPEAFQTACNLQLRSDGIDFVGTIQTGNRTAGESGMFVMTVTEDSTSCSIPYGERVQELLDLNVQLECRNTTCYGSRDGYVKAYVRDGTPIPIPNITAVQGNNNAQYYDGYYFRWESPVSVANQAVTTSVIDFAPAGHYRVNVTDWEGCVTTASCDVISTAPPMVLVPVSSTPPNCTGQTGTVKFQVINGTGQKTLYKISPAAMTGPSSALLTDTTVVPGINSTYVVMDEAGCVSPQVSFRLDDAARFDLVVVANRYPCSLGSATGRMTAIVPQGMGAVVEWYLTESNTLQGSGILVLDGAVAATYTVIATSSLYGCKVIKYFTLDVRMPPTITVNRIAEAPNVGQFLDKLTGAINSDNGPPYVVTFYDIVVNTLSTGPTYSQAEVGNLLNIEMHMIPQQTTFLIQAVDSGGCVSTYKSRGHEQTTQGNIPSPTALPNITQHLIEIKETMNNWYITTVVGACTIVVTFLFLVINANSLIPSTQY